MIRIHLGIDDLRKPRARFALDWLASAVGVFLRECESEVGLWEFWYGEEPDNDLVRKVALDGGLLVWMYANDEITSGPPSFDQQTHSQLKCDGVEDVPVWGLTREMSAGEAWGTSGGRTVITAERVGQGLICRIGCDLVSTVWWALARVEEQGADSLRDQHGRAKSDANTLVKAGCHHTPVLDRYAELLIWLFDRCWQTLGRPWVRIGRWPDDHSAVVLFSHDVDVLRKWTPWRVFHEMINTGRSGVSLINRAAQIIRQSDLSNDPYAAVGRTCDFEREAGVTSTWFMSAGRKNSLDPSYTLNHPLLHAAVGQIDSIGGEVGLHASYSWADSSDGLGFGRSVLGRTFGREVCGNRTHYLRHQAGATWQALESAGFAYDATLGFSDDVGFRSWTSLLFHPYDVTADRAHSFAELPLSLMDVSLLWRLGVDRSEAIRISRSLWNSTANGGICSALFHPNGYDVEDYAYLAEWFEELVGWAVDDHRWMPTHIGLVEWWRARAQAKVTDNGGAWRFDSAPQGLTVIVGGRGSGETVKVAFGDDVHHIGVGERYVVPRPSSRSTKAASLKKPASDRSKVVMTVFNDLHHDARVNKEAVTLAENGYQVTVIANRTSER
ncbi:MAG: hypothetical protein QGH20_04770, partial [Candidatus Latescibacteria bacterium]|nr:hypothetical protein [Candidatus Latescibacterota bacterium]